MNEIRTWFPGWLAAFLGFPLGGLAASLLAGRFETVSDGLIGGAIAGLIIGTTQYLALRRRLPLGGIWIALTAVGLSAGVAMGAAFLGTETTVAAIVLRAPLAGLCMGLAQALALRQHLRLAVLWVPAVCVIFTLAWFITTAVIGTGANEGFYVFGASGAIVYQILTGLVLAVLLKPASSQAAK